MDLETDVVPILMGIGGLKEGETYSFIHRTAMKTSSWSPSFIQRYMVENVISTLTDLESLVESVESYNGNNQNLTVRLFTHIEAAEEGFKHLSTSHPDKKDEINNLYMRLKNKINTDNYTQPEPEDDTKKPQPPTPLLSSKQDLANHHLMCSNYQMTSAYRRNWQRYML
jgi:hypothetical protein